MIGQALNLHTSSKCGRFSSPCSDLTDNRTVHCSLMTIDLVPLPLPASADASKFTDFGREVRGVNPGKLTSEEFKEVQDALYKVCLVLRIS